MKCLTLLLPSLLSVSVNCSDLPQINLLKSLNLTTNTSSYREVTSVRGHYKAYAYSLNRKYSYLPLSARRNLSASP